MTALVERLVALCRMDEAGEALPEAPFDLSEAAGEAAAAPERSRPPPYRGGLFYRNKKTTLPQQAFFPIKKAPRRGAQLCGERSVTRTRLRLVELAPVYHIFPKQSMGTFVGSRLRRREIC